VTSAALLVWLAAWPAAAPTDISAVLAGVENRYNRAKTLRVAFSETYVQGRTRRTESGTLYLRKPGRMRWEYSNPPGKLFVSDGKFLYLYTPDSNRVERSKAKETEDMRAPLAFLLGKLNFRRDFGRFTFRAEGEDTYVKAEPSNANLPYSLVEFVVTPGYRIKQVRVTGQDRSVLDFSFSNEAVDPALDASLFTFRTPPGAEVIELSE
jgi:outer membrane lipoprotein carrier protein